MSRLLVAADLHLEKGMDYSADRLGEQEAVWAKIVQARGQAQGRRAPVRR
jgi:hypothetical protein